MATVAERLGEHEGRLDGFERWQKAQNGTLLRIEGRQNQILALVLAALLALVGNLVLRLLGQ